MSLKTVLGWDYGFGHNKIILGTSDGKIIKQYKFSSIIGVTERNPHINDSRIVDFKEHSYYVGEDAVGLPSENLIDITEYKNLEYYAPLFLYTVLKQINIIPDIIVTGLSKAQIENSGYFKEALQNFTVNDETFSFDKIFVLPQGAGSKLCIDEYGDNFPHKQEQFMGDTTFVGVDIGFQSLDLFNVQNGKTSPNLFEGIEKEGVMKIATKIAQKVKEVHGRGITLHEAKDIIDTGVYRLRGQSHEFKEYVDEVKKEYLKELLELIESRYGDILDKCDFIFLSGGGSTIFKTTDNGFIRTPKSAHEFFNSIGFFRFGATRA